MVPVEIPVSAGGRATGEPLNIAYLFQQFPLPTETFAMSDIAALAANGHSVTVYTMKRRRSDEGALLKAGALANIKIRRPTLSGALKWPLLGWRWRGPLGGLAARLVKGVTSDPRSVVEAFLCLPRLIEIAENVCADNADVAHAFWSRHVGLVLPLLAATRSTALRSAFVGAYDLVADDLLVKMTLGSSEAVFSHAEANRAYLERASPPSAVKEIVRRGIPLVSFNQNIERDSFRCITASALVRSKNVDAVIAAFAAARQREARLTLSIFGDGPDRSRLQQVARRLGCRDSVLFGGYIPRHALFDELQRSQIFLLLSQKPSERLPNVVKEAMWAGCAVIASNSEGIGELIPKPEFGRIVDPDATQDIANAIAEMVREPPGLASTRRRTIRNFIAKNFSSDRSMAQYVSCWRRAIGQRRTRPPKQRSPRAALSRSPRRASPPRSPSL